jgi:hypothetical protein
MDIKNPLMTRPPNFYDIPDEINGGLYNESKIDSYNLGDLPMNPEIVGIYIGTHGRLLSTLPLLENIDGVTIIKKNKSALCAVAGGLSKYRIVNATTIAQSLLKDFFISQDKDQVINSSVYKKEEHSHYNLSSSASLFTNPSEGWMQKIYTYHGEINCSFAIAYLNKSIELLHCTKSELDDFFEDIHHPNIESFKRFLYGSIVNSQTKTFYTKDIWWIIKFFKKICGVKTVRILDETCNGVEPITTKTGAQAWPVTRLSSNAGFGGSKKIKKRKTTRKILRFKKR